MKWAKESLNGGLRVDYLVLVKDEENIIFSQLTMRKSPMPTSLRLL